MEIYQRVQQLVEQAVTVRLIEEEDAVYARNQILSLLRLEEFHQPDQGAADKDIPDLLEDIAEFACRHGVIEDLFDEREMLTSKIMNCFVPAPSIVNRRFYEKYEESPEAATGYFYELSKNSNYIQTKRTDKNITYKVETAYGELDITINLSKPEKDPKQIAREKERETKGVNYPKCLLCVENEGYAGRIGHPARSNHRLIRMNLLDEEWFFQYSPYAYYNEHSIVLSGTHRDMKINRDTFANLLAFVQKHPHYFIGSNADLPIVGGSILTHDHYQAGKYEFAMAKAEDSYCFSLETYPSIACSIVKWPMSVIRLRGADTEELVDASTYILNKWKVYENPSVDIYAFSGDVPHNTITPIARKRGDLYEVDLVLRNNRTDEEHPLGIFHPHADLHHIKKENIGLIEVMGLAVLPARLQTELQEVEMYVLGQSPSVVDSHKEWADMLKEQYAAEVNRENVKAIVQDEAGKKFLRVLQDAGVFKEDEQGRAAFQHFIALLNE